ncbi:MAG: hypothetical protein IK130_09865 [Oscillospiraceae bacterium]|nr:hypothetical protein [Oscillospiraceae bacterium]
MNFIDVLNQTGRLFQSLLMTEHGHSLSPTRFLIVDPSRKLGVLAQILRNNTSDMNVLCLTETSEDGIVLPEKGSDDWKSYFQLTGTAQIHTAVIALAEDAEAMGSLVKLLFTETAQKTEIYGPPGEALLRLTCYRIFTDEDILAKRCHEYAEKLCPVLHAHMQNRQITPELSMVHLFWQTESSSDVYLSRLGEQILYMQANSMESNSLLKSGGDFTEESYPWIAFTLQETHAAELPLLQYFSDMLDNACRMTLPEMEVDLAGAADAVRAELLRRLALHDMAEVNRNLAAWCGYVPVPIDRDEFERRTDIVMRREEPVKKKSGLFGGLFSRKPAENSVTEHPEQIGTPFNADVRALSAQYADYIQREISPEEFCVMIFSQLKGLSAQLPDPSLLLPDIRKLIHTVFHPDGASAEGTVWETLSQHYQRAVTADIVRQCHKLMLDQLTAVRTELNNQLMLWRNESPTSMEAPHIRNIMKLRMAGSADAIYAQLVAYLAELQSDEDFRRTLKSAWNNMNFKTAQFGGVMHSPLITGEDETEMVKYNEGERRDIPISGASCARNIHYVRALNFKYLRK